MTPSEALSAVADAGVVLAVNPLGQLTARPPGRLAPEVKAALSTHKGQLVALLRLRQVHRLMGFDAADVLLIERAILSGQVNQVVIVAAPAESRPA